MNSHVSAILLGVRDMERSKRFYAEGLGWKVQNDWGISVFFVPHGGSVVGFYGRDGLAANVGVAPEGTGFSGVVFNLCRPERATRRRDHGGGREGGREDPQTRDQGAMGRLPGLIRGP